MNKKIASLAFLGVFIFAFVVIPTPGPVVRPHPIVHRAEFIVNYDPMTGITTPYQTISLHCPKPEIICWIWHA